MSEITSKGPEDLSKGLADRHTNTPSTTTSTTPDRTLHEAQLQATFDWAEPTLPLICSRESVMARWEKGRDFETGTTIKLKELPSVGPLQGILQVTVSGPSDPGPSSFVRSLLSRSTPTWNQVTFELRIGGGDCPTWEAANKKLLAVTHLTMQEDGLVSDSVLQALKEHLHVIDSATFRGPPKK